jgi:prophage regulatory protein
MHDIHILRAPEVSRRVGLTREYIYVLERSGKFPKRVKISANRVGWIASEIDDWLRERVAARDVALAAK